MSIFKTYLNLTPKAKLGVGAGLLLWGVVGLHLSDTIEAKLGYTPTEADKAELARVMPRIHVVSNKSGDGSGGEKA